MKYSQIILVIVLLGIGSYGNCDLSREETMLLGLKQGPKSAGLRLSRVYANSESMMVDLNKALTQIHVVSKNFAKLKNKPYESYFPNSNTNLDNAIKTLKEFQKQIILSHKELKAEVESTILEN